MASGAQAERGGQVLQLGLGVWSSAWPKERHECSKRSASAPMPHASSAAVRNWGPTRLRHSQPGVKGRKLDAAGRHETTMLWSFSSTA